jgi:hypothetical protein
MPGYLMLMKIYGLINVIVGAIRMLNNHQQNVGNQMMIQ